MYTFLRFSARVLTKKYKIFDYFIEVSDVNKNVNK